MSTNGLMRSQVKPNYDWIILDYELKVLVINNFMEVVEWKCKWWLKWKLWYRQENWWINTCIILFLEFIKWPIKMNICILKILFFFVGVLQMFSYSS
jgi:hypothetical protein